MKSTVGRNEKCQCGSGKKYKKCCLNNQTNQLQINKKFESLNFLDNRFYSPKRNSLLLYVVDSCKVPLVVRNEVYEYTKKEKLVQYGCWYNSSHLTLLNEKIEVVHGFYGVKMTPDDINNLEKLVTSKRLKPNKDNWYKNSEYYGDIFYDLKNNVEITPHSWNRVWDNESQRYVHFDLTKENDETLQKDWVFYYPVKTENSSSLRIGMKSELIEMTKIRKNKCPYPQIN